MKTKQYALTALMATGLVLSSLVSVRAAVEEETIKGEGKCGKCALKETKSCQNVIEVKKGGKSEFYYLVDNELSKKFHENLCKGPKEVTAKGTVKKVDGKLELTATKIELVKK